MDKYEEAKETVGTAEPLNDSNPTALLTFGEALEALKEGKKIAREGWNGKGMFIFQQVPSKVSMEIVEKMTSLPPAVKQEFISRYTAEPEEGDEISKDFESIRYQNQIAMVYPDNNIYGWVASPSDILENDWAILD